MSVYIWTPDIGDMLVLSVDYTAKSVGELKQEIQRMHQWRIPVHKQKLFVAGGTILADGRSVASYQGGLDSNPFVLIDKRKYDLSEHAITRHDAYIPTPACEEKNIGSIRCTHNNIIHFGEQASTWSASYDCIETRSHLVDLFCKYGESHLAVATLLKKHHFEQLAGFNTVKLAAEEKYSKKVKKELDKMRKRHARYKDTLPELQKMIEEFSKSQELMNQITVPESMVTAMASLSQGMLPPSERSSEINQDISSAQPSTSMADSLSSTPATSRDASPAPQAGSTLQRVAAPESPAMPEPGVKKSLSEWLVGVDKRDPVGTLKAKLDESMAKIQQPQISKLIEEASQHEKFLQTTGRQLADMPDITTRLGTVDQKLNEIQAEVGLLKSRQNLFNQHLQRAKQHIHQVEEIAEISRISSEQMNRVVTSYKQILCTFECIVNSKRDFCEIFSRWLMVFLKRIDAMEATEQASSTMRSFIERAQKYHATLGQVVNTPEIFVRCLVEASRRKIFSTRYSNWADLISNDSTYVYDREITRRTSFMQRTSNHFVLKLITGFKDQPSQFAMTAPEPFDQNVPDVTVEDLDRICSDAPQLSYLVKMDDMDIPAHLQSTLSPGSPTLAPSPGDETGRSRKLPKRPATNRKSSSSRSPSPTPLPASLRGGKDFVPVGGAKVKNEQPDSMTTSNEMFHSFGNAEDLASEGDTYQLAASRELDDFAATDELMDEISPAGPHSAEMHAKIEAQKQHISALAVQLDNHKVVNSHLRSQLNSVLDGFSKVVQTQEQPILVFQFGLVDYLCHQHGDVPPHLGTVPGQLSTLADQFKELKKASETEISGIQANLRDVQTSLQEAEKKVTEREAELKRKDSKMKDLEETVDDLHLRYEQSEGRLTEMKTQFEAQIAGSEVKHASALAQLNETQGQIKKLLASHQEALASQQNELQSKYKKELQDLKAEQEETLEDRGQELKDLQSLVEHLRTEILKAEEDHDSQLQVQYSELESRWERRLEGVRAEMMEQKLDALQAQKREDDAELERQLVEKHSEFQKEVDETIRTEHKENQELTIRVQELKTDVAKLQRHIERMKETYQEDLQIQEKELEADFQERLSKVEDDHARAMRNLLHDKDQALTSLRTEHELVMDSRERDVGRTIEKYRRETEEKAEGKVAEMKQQQEEELSDMVAQYQRDLKAAREEYKAHVEAELQKSMVDHREDVRLTHEEDMRQLSLTKDAEKMAAIEEVNKQHEQKLFDRIQEIEDIWQDKLEVLRLEMEAAAENDRITREEEVKDKLDALESKVRLELDSIIQEKEQVFAEELREIESRKEQESQAKLTEVENDWQEHVRCQEQEHTDTLKARQEQHQRELQKMLSDQKEKLENERSLALSELRDGLTLDYQKRVREVTTQMESKESELAEMEEQLAKLSGEREMVEERYHQLLTGKHEEMEETMNTSQATAAQLQEQLAASKEENRQLKEEAEEEKEELEEKISTAQWQLNRAREEATEHAENLQTKINTLQVTIDGHCKEMNDLREVMNEEAKAKHAQLEVEKIETERTLMKLQLEVAEKEAEIAKVKQERDSIDRSVEGQVAVVRAEKAEKETELIEAMDQLRDKLEEQLNHAMHELSRAQQETEHVRAEMQEKLSLEDELQTIKEELNKAYEQAASATADLERKLTDSQQTLDQVSQENVELKKMMEVELDQAEKVWQVQLNESKQQREQLVEQLKMAHQDMAVFKDESAKIHRELESELDNSQRQLSKARGEALQVRAQLEERLSSVTQQLEIARSTSSQMAGGRQGGDDGAAIRDDLEEQVSSLLKQLEAAQAEASYYKVKVEASGSSSKQELEQSLQEAEISRQELSERVGALEASRDGLDDFDTTMKTKVESELRLAKMKEQDAMEKVSELQAQVEALRVVSPGPTTTASDTVDHMMTSSMMQSVVFSPEGSGQIQKLELELKDKEERIANLQTRLDALNLSSSARSMLDEKLTVHGCNPGDVVLLHYSERYRNYLVFLLQPTLHFVHTDCLEVLGLVTPDGLRNMMILAEVESKEYCQARRFPNRFHVPKDTKFHRVKVIPWSRPTDTQLASATIVPFTPATDRVHGASSHNSQGARPTTPTSGGPASSTTSEHSTSQATSKTT